MGTGKGEPEFWAAEVKPGVSRYFRDAGLTALAPKMFHGTH